MADSGAPLSCSTEETVNRTLFVYDDEHLEDNVVEVENCLGLNDVVVSELDDGVPEVGMKFKEVEEAFEFYKKYAYRVGFPVRKRNSRKGADGIVRNVAFTCSREGRRTSTTSTSLKPQATIQTGCKARVNAVSDVNGIWRISAVKLDHNHKCSPSKSRLYRCNRQISEHVKRKLEVNDIAGIPLHKSYNSVVVEAGGYEETPFIEKDCRNYIDKVRRLRLGDGDAAALQCYFSKMQAQCPGFYCNVDLDEECRLRNVFWADNRCRQAYKEFGDVVTFDTTYLRNRYDMPFAPFVGVNRHGQSTLLGCGLISNEDTQTFVWLFQTWLQCMGGQSPMGIITDQDRAMQNAIQIVFPGTRHRWCLWHILKKLPEKFGGHEQKGGILTTVHVLVYESQSPEDFEEGWSLMIGKYSLEENAWLAGLYKERSRWVPCYLITSFWAGMSTTQRSESMNAFFDGYVHSKTSLKQFVEQYERALRSKVEKEFHADFKSFSQMIPCATKYGMEKQFQLAYTLSKFKEFQEEFSGMVYCRIVSNEEGVTTTVYEVVESIIFEEGMKKKKFTLAFERATSHIVCSCHLFEFRGILCKHAITVLISNDVTVVPDMYILRRWRKDVSRAHTRVKINYNGWITTPSQVRYDELCAEFGKIADAVADDELQTAETKSWLAAKMTELHISSSKTIRHIQDSVLVASERGSGDIVSSSPILDPKCTTRKGAPRKNRKKGPLETGSKKNKVQSKSTLSKTSLKKDEEKDEESTQASQVSSFPVLNHLSFSQQLMGTHYPIWPPSYSINIMPPVGIDQHTVTYFPPAGEPGRNGAGHED